MENEAWGSLCFLVVLFVLRRGINNIWGGGYDIGLVV